MAEIQHASRMIFYFFVIGCSLYLALMVAKVILALTYSRKDRQIEATPLRKDTLTVAQAILSGDPSLLETLEGNLATLSGQRFLWLCDQEDAEAIRVTDKLIGRHPEENITVRLCPPCPAGVNPKVFKLTQACGLLTPYVLVLDDDTRLPAITAANLALHARTNGVATGLPIYSIGNNFPSALLAQFVNNNSAMTYLSLLPIMRPLSINGMCYVIKSVDAERFPGISHHLTDDLAMASVMKKHGGIYQSSHPQVISTHVNSISHYIRFMHRWYLFALILVRQQTNFHQFIILLFHGWHPLLLWGLLITMVMVHSPAMLGLFLALLAVRSLLLRVLHRRIFQQRAHRILTSILSELLQPLHLVHALANRNIVWRNRRYQVFSSDKFEPND